MVRSDPEEPSSSSPAPAGCRGRRAGEEGADDDSTEESMSTDRGLDGDAAREEEPPSVTSVASAEVVDSASDASVAAVEEDGGDWERSGIAG